MGFYFDKYLNIANGVSTSAIGVGVMLFPFLIQFLLDTLAWRGALMIYGGVCLQTCVFGALMIPAPIERKQKPKDKEECVEMVNLNHFEDKKDIVISKSGRNKRSTIGESIYSYLILFRNKKFSLYCISYFGACAGVASVYMHLQAFAVQSGIDRHRTNHFVTVMGLGGVIGRFSSGFLLRICKLSNLVMYIIYMVIAGTATCTLPFYATDYIGFMVFSSIFGYFGNLYQVFCGPLTQKFVGVENLAIAFGILLLIGGTSYLLSPPLTGKDGLCMQDLIISHVQFKQLFLVWSYLFYFERKSQAKLSSILIDTCTIYLICHAL